MDNFTPNPTKISFTTIASRDQHIMLMNQDATVVLAPVMTLNPLYDSFILPIFLFTTGILLKSHFKKLNNFEILHVVNIIARIPSIAIVNTERMVECTKIRDIIIKNVIAKRSCHLSIIMIGNVFDIGILYFFFR